MAEWVNYGLFRLDPYATVLGIEQFLDRTFHPDDGSPPIPLVVVIELLLLRTVSKGVTLPGPLQTNQAHYALYSLADRLRHRQARHARY